MAIKWHISQVVGCCIKNLIPELNNGHTPMNKEGFELLVRYWTYGPDSHLYQYFISIKLTLNLKRNCHSIENSNSRTGQRNLFNIIFSKFKFSLAIQDLFPFFFWTGLLGPRKYFILDSFFLLQNSFIFSECSFLLARLRPRLAQDILHP